MALRKHRYIVVEGPIGVGKTTLARLLAERAGAGLLLENPDDNPFLASIYQDRRRWALATQLFFLFQRVNQLAARADTNEDELLALGRRFGIVSPATSLIVLENIEQYVRHDIEPPASQPELRWQWHERKTSLAQEEKRQRDSKLRRVLGK